MQHDFFLPHLSVWIPKKKEQLGFAGYFFDNSSKTTKYKNIKNIFLLSNFLRMKLYILDRKKIEPHKKSRYALHLIFEREKTLLNV